MNELAETVQSIELEIAELADGTDAARAAAVLDRVNAWIEFGRSMKAKLGAAMIEFIKANGDLTIGPVRYYVGSKKAVKCRDLGETAKTMLELGGVDLLRDVLSSGAFKHGESRKRLDELGSPELFDVLFETTQEEQLKDGKPVKKDSLLSFDDRFVR